MKKDEVIAFDHTRSRYFVFLSFIFVSLAKLVALLYYVVTT